MKQRRRAAGNPEEELEEATRTIWELIRDSKAPELEEAATSVRQANIVFLGAKQSGKSTLKQAYMFKEKNEVPRPTVALEYKYTRSFTAMSHRKEVSHFWEVGGGRTFARTLETCMHGHNVHDTLCILAADLSAPQEMCESLLFWLGELKTRTQECLRKSPRIHGKSVHRLLQEQVDEIFNGNPDARSVKPMAVPIVIVGTKYDLIKDNPPSELKLISQALRAIAHYHGASLVYTSRKQRSSLQHVRQYISRHIMQKAHNKKAAVSDDPNNSIIMPAGRDAFSKIGNPGPEFVRPRETVCQAWARQVAHYFPEKPTNSTEKSMSVDGNMKLPTEPEIDNLLAEKLERLKADEQQNANTAPHLSKPKVLRKKGRGKRGGATTRKR